MDSRGKIRKIGSVINQTGMVPFARQTEIGYGLERRKEKSGLFDDRWKKYDPHKDDLTPNEILALREITDVYRNTYAQYQKNDCWKDEKTDQYFLRRARCETSYSHGVSSERMKSIMLRAFRWKGNNVDPEIIGTQHLRQGAASRIEEYLRFVEINHAELPILYRAPVVKKDHARSATDSPELLNALDELAFQLENNYKNQKVHRRMVTRLSKKSNVEYKEILSALYRAVDDSDRIAMMREIDPGIETLYAMSTAEGGLLNLAESIRNYVWTQRDMHEVKKRAEQNRRMQEIAEESTQIGA